MSTLSAKTFISVWQNASSPEEAANKCGLTRGSAIAKAVVYRKKGIALKKFPQGRPRLDVESLNKIAKGK